MSGGKLLSAGTSTLFARVETRQYEFLRYVAFTEHRSLAAVVRSALDQYMGSRTDIDPEQVKTFMDHFEVDFAEVPRPTTKE